MAGSIDAQPGTVEAAVSAAVERLYLEKFGKGPLHTETTIHGDTMTTVMHDVFNAAERALVQRGRSDSVLTTRMLWQEATDQAFKTAVGEAVGRRVLTVVSGYELHDEVATEVFILEPEPQ
ncbi:MAG: hypothetical protein QOF76_771 [Solirubrobacteraceae bacterium]|jgi:uncharacterized protein YbcI|nr:hypothetical protein [Solirubrobacteraceae bacterium]